MTELGNKLSVYWRVRVSGPRRAAGLPLPERVAAVLRAAPDDPDRAVFELEGVAFDAVRTLWQAGTPPAGLLSAAAGLPEESLVLLHSGLGFGLADRLLRPLRRERPVADLDAAIGRFLDLCRANSRPAYLPVARESLGLFTRMFRRRLAGPVDAALRRVDPNLAAGFWHGAGRALYFRPDHLLPGGLSCAVRCCRREPPPENRLDALAGLAFAVAMINLRHPPALERLLARVDEEGEEGEAVASGVAGSILARFHTLPGDPAVVALLSHRPADPRRHEAWERRVSGPGATALGRLYTPLQARGRLGDLARFQRLPALEASLREEGCPCVP